MSLKATYDAAFAQFGEAQTLFNATRVQYRRGDASAMALRVARSILIDYQRALDDAEIALIEHNRANKAQRLRRAA